MNAHISERRAAPMWAVLGAPLLGVPLMVFMLSLAVPATATPGVAPEAEQTIEQVEVLTVDNEVEPLAVYDERLS